MKTHVTLLFVSLGFCTTISAQTPISVFIEELTWTEVQDALDEGYSNIIVPTAGTEQSGPHIVLGKHRYRMEVASERIAKELGNTLVAPVLTHVPEGSIDPSSGHMRYAGTISIPQDVFRAVLEYTARSLKVHGFKNILFIGDSGPNQPGMKAVSEKLNEEWAREDSRVLFISDWYSNTQFRDWLIEQGYSEDEIGRHAGLLDTALLLAVAPQHVRTNIVAKGKGIDIDGVSGDPAKASIELGKIGFQMNLDAALAQIRNYIGQD